MNTSATTSSQASYFVTVVAWSFIALSGPALFISILQSILLNFVFDAAKFDVAGQFAGMPPALAFVAAHFRTLIACVLVAAATMLVASIGVLKRRNWARRLLIVMLVPGIVWSIGGMLQQYSVFYSPTFAPASMPADFKGIFAVMRLVRSVMSLGIAILLAWIIKRLMSAPVVAEFTQR